MQPAVKKYDIAGLKNLVTAIAEGANVVDAVLADGTVDVRDLPKVPALLSALKTLAAVSFKDLPNEASEVDAAEAKELADLFAAKFNIANDSIETTVEQGFYIVYQVVTAVATIRYAVNAALGKNAPAAA